MPSPASFTLPATGVAVRRAGALPDSGSLAAVAYFVLVQARLLPAARGTSLHLRSWAPVVWVVVVGASVAVVWEFYEWVIEQVNPAGMSVGYTDTVVDLFAGMLGSLTAGGLVLWWARRHGAEQDATAFRAVA